MAKSPWDSSMAESLHYGSAKRSWNPYEDALSSPEKENSSNVTEGIFCHHQEILYSFLKVSNQHKSYLPDILILQLQLQSVAPYKNQSTINSLSCSYLKPGETICPLRLTLQLSMFSPWPTTWFFLKTDPELICMQIFAEPQWRALYSKF